ncbi:MAG: RhuM family protein [Bacilli bacterium]|nr:RhuM family protein [Bacilli bacterium]
MEEKYRIIKFNNKNLEIDVKISPFEKTIWLSLDQIALLFERDKSVISRHIKNIFEINELDEISCVAFFATELNKYDPRTGKMRKTKVDVKLFNLDVIISVGYRVNSIMGVTFRKWANEVLKEYLIKGYAINEERSLVTNENYVRLINKVESLDERVSNIEKEYKPKEFKNTQLFFDGEFYDSYTLIQSLFESANKEIIIIDNYVERTILDRLVVKNSNVKVVIYTSINSRLLTKDIDTFNNQYGGLDVRYTANVHDRYIIIDQNKLYHLGHSIKDLGKKIFSISESDNSLISVLLSNI